MIKFFRQIRQKLLTENRFNKYLIYAIGEIILVVIGILIALQVNNWNEARKNRKQEINFLSRIQADIKTDIENISGSIRTNKSRMKRAEFLLASIDQPQLVKDSATYFIQSIEYAGYTNNPIISDNTFEEIKSSGKLSFIRNENLRSAIQEYYSWTSERGQYNFILQDIQLDYLRVRRGILSAQQQINMGSFKQSKQYTIAEAKDVYSRMIKNSGFLELLPFTIQSQIRTGESFESIKRQAIELNKMIEKETTNKSILND